MVTVRLKRDTVPGPSESSKSMSQFRHHDQSRLVRETVAIEGTADIDPRQRPSKNPPQALGRYGNYRHGARSKENIALEAN
jgi:hypothetical protein